MDVTVRPATEADVSFLTDVVVEATFHQGRLPEDFDEADFRQGFGEWTAEQVRGELDGSVTSVVQVDGVDAGRLRVVRHDSLVEIAGLQLLPDQQSRGVGRVVVSGVVAQARADGLPVEPSVPAAAPAALRTPSVTIRLGSDVANAVSARPAASSSAPATSTRNAPK